MIEERVMLRPSISEVKKQYEDELVFDNHRAAAEYA
jgi:hypothetical protein